MVYGRSVCPLGRYTHVHSRVHDRLPWKPVLLVPKMVKCPYCSRPAMSLMRKSGLGPGRTINCQSCGKPVTTHSMSVFAAIPAFLGGIVALKSASLLLGGAAIAGGVLTMGFIHTFLVPLVRSDA